MSGLYVTDTDSIISFFNDIFEVPQKLSARARGVISQALLKSPSEVKLSIPSVVFIEIFEKWIISEEFARKLHYEVYNIIIESPNIEIKPIEQEVLENLLEVRDNLSRHEINDKIIVASAMMLHCPIITTDPEIIKYVRKTPAIPSILN